MNEQDRQLINYMRTRVSRDHAAPYGIRVRRDDERGLGEYNQRGFQQVLERGLLNALRGPYLPPQGSYVNSRGQLVYKSGYLCGDCGKRFSRVSPFEEHRRGTFERRDEDGTVVTPNSRRCLTSSELRAKGFRCDETGVWKGAETDLSAVFHSVADAERATATETGDETPARDTVSRVR